MASVVRPRPDGLHHASSISSSSFSAHKPHALQIVHHCVEVLDRLVRRPSTLSKTASRASDHSSDAVASSDAQDSTFMPRADVRATDTHYNFDIELPGVSDKGTITVHWISSRSFVVEGRTSRPGYHSQSDCPYCNTGATSPLALCPGSSDGDTEIRAGTREPDYQALHRNASPERSSCPVQEDAEWKSYFGPWADVDSENHDPTLMVSERHIGRYKRGFSVPIGVAVDIQGTEATLEAGLLLIRVPKVHRRTTG